MGGQDECDTTLFEAIQPVPQHVTSLRVKASGGFVEE
jgi:hypothetical protein